MKNNNWHEGTLTQLEDLLASFDAVQSIFLVGSLADDAVQTDRWSDIDLVIVVSDQAINNFFPGSGWLEPFHPVFATSCSQLPPRYTLRVCFKDMRRVDFIFLLSSALSNAEKLHVPQFHSAYQVLFSRSPIDTDILFKDTQAVAEAHNIASQFQEMTNDFWFKGNLAVYKVMRNDLLIALHLSLDMMRDCLVLRMMLRDRETGTRHHRIGGNGNEFLAQFNAQLAANSAERILTAVEYYSQVYDNLAKEWLPDYETKCDPLLNWVSQARHDLSHQLNGTK